MADNGMAAQEHQDIDEAAPRKPARRILEHEISEGLGEIQRSSSGLLIAGVSAGLDVGFSLFLMGVMITQTNGRLPEAIVHILVSSMYAIGYIFVILGRSELFTEHTTLAVLPVLNGRATLPDLARIWALIYVSNLLGGAVFALLAGEIGPALGSISVESFGLLARSVVDHPGWVILLSAVLAGWMMGLVSWLVAAGRDTISQIVLVWLVTFAIGFSQLHHCIVGSIEVLAGLFTGQGLTWGQFGHFLFWSTIGNSLGGVIFVALIKYSHVVRSHGQSETVELKESADGTLQ